MDKDGRHAEEIISAFILHTPIDVLRCRNNEAIDTTIIKAQKDIDVVVIRIKLIDTTHHLDIHDNIMATEGWLSSK